MLHTLIDFTNDLFDAHPGAAGLTVDRHRSPAPPLVAYLLASVRIVAWLLVAPPFSSRAVPTLAKVAARARPGASRSCPAWTGERARRTPSALIGARAQEALIGAVDGLRDLPGLRRDPGRRRPDRRLRRLHPRPAFDPLSHEHEHRASASSTDARHDAAVRQRRAPAGDRRPAPHLRRCCRSATARQPPSVTEVVTAAFGMFFAAAVQIALPLIARAVPGRPRPGPADPGRPAAERDRRSCSRPRSG